MNNAAMNPITEDDIANFLVNTPDFFERHAELLSAVKLTSPHSHRAVSLQERQAEMMREKIRALELRMMDMMRHGTENEVLIERMQRWVKTLLMTNNARDLPHTIADHIQHDFMVPQVAIKVWDVREDFKIDRGLAFTLQGFFQQRPALRQRLGFFYGVKPGANFGAGARADCVAVREPVARRAGSARCCRFAFGGDDFHCLRVLQRCI